MSECDGWHNIKECPNKPTWKALNYLCRFNVPLESKHCDSCKKHIDDVGFGYSGGEVLWKEIVKR